MILHNSASKLNQYWEFCEIKYRERVVNLASNRSNFLNEEYEPSLLVDKIHDLALSQKQSFLLDGTLGNYAKAEQNIVRSLKRRRLDQILYVYQEPMLAWNFVMDREVVEGRKINPKDFITQYFSARDVVNRLKIEFGSKVGVDLLLKNTDNSHRLYKAGVDQIDNHIPEKYKPADLEKMPGLVQSNRMSILAKKRTAKFTVFLTLSAMLLLARRNVSIPLY